MVAGVLPFQKKGGHSHKGGVTNCPVFKLLPPPLQKESKDNGFLLDYIHTIPVDEVGIPEYYEELDRKLSDQKNPNLIYPIGGGLFVHIYPDPTDSRDYYIAIQPGMLDDTGNLVEAMEDRLVDFVEELESSANAKLNRAEVLRKILGKVVVVVRPGTLKQARLKAKKKNGSRLPVTKDQLETLRYELVRDKEGMGVLVRVSVVIDCFYLPSTFLRLRRSAHSHQSR